ncbi:hypothetical protein [Atopococcus tabaci]|uniref:hypothetical protein n=1 Tax=Atopococcus tabaci TaxID=269774 RepID=UPI00308419BC
MQIIHLSPFWTVIVDVCAWAFFHLVISFGMLKVPNRYFAQKRTGFSQKNGRMMEKSGKNGCPSRIGNVICRTGRCF